LRGAFAQDLNSPKQRIFFYSPTEWEEFVSEWVTGLGENYEQIMQFGGPGDRGVDIAGFKSKHGFEGRWECFQCKHYAGPLNPADAYEEILKMFRHVLAGHYKLPDAYSFMAPQGCGMTLKQELTAPTVLRANFLKRLDKGGALVKGLAPTEVKKIRDYAKAVDFSMFRSSEIHEVLEVHSNTRYYAARFAEPLRDRKKDVADIPEAVTDAEARYVQQLVEVYGEKYPDGTFHADMLSGDKKVAKHFKQQRVRFFEAEALRLYARDSVPEGTFEALQQDLLSGVIDTAESDHSTGWNRLTSVLAIAGQIDLSSHTLMTRAFQDDRKGICHQLANQDELLWVTGDV
jgi:hypothetical protein